METKSISQMVKILGGTISRNSSTILTYLAVSGLVTTGILVGRATVPAWFILEDERTRREEDHARPYEELTLRDIVRLTWRCYIAALGVGAATAGCIIGANSIALRRSAALASVYGITEAAFREYQHKVVETIGRSKELQVRDSIAADNLSKNPSSANEVIFTGKGTVLCYDSLSGRYFRGDIEQIRRSVNELNRQLMTEMFISVNELYYLLKLPGIQLGAAMGWNVDDGLLEMSFSSQLTEDSEPCLVLNYDVVPRYLP